MSRLLVNVYALHTRISSCLAAATSCHCHPSAYQVPDMHTVLGHSYRLYQLSAPQGWAAQRLLAYTSRAPCAAHGLGVAPLAQRWATYAHQPARSGNPADVEVDRSKSGSKSTGQRSYKKKPPRDPEEWWTKGPRYFDTARILQDPWANLQNKQLPLQDVPTPADGSQVPADPVSVHSASSNSGRTDAYDGATATGGNTEVRVQGVGVYAPTAVATPASSAQLYAAQPVAAEAGIKKKVADSQVRSQDSSHMSNAATHGGDGGGGDGSSTSIKHVQYNTSSSTHAAPAGEVTLISGSSSSSTAANGLSGSGSHVDPSTASSSSSGNPAVILPTTAAQQVKDNIPSASNLAQLIPKELARAVDHLQMLLSYQDADMGQNQQPRGNTLNSYSQPWLTVPVTAQQPKHIPTSQATTVALQHLAQQRDKQHSGRLESGTALLGLRDREQLAALRQYQGGLQGAVSRMQEAQTWAPVAQGVSMLPFDVVHTTGNQGPSMTHASNARRARHRTEVQHDEVMQQAVMCAFSDVSMTAQPEVVQGIIQMAHLHCLPPAQAATNLQQQNTQAESRQRHSQQQGNSHFSRRLQQYIHEWLQGIQQLEQQHPGLELISQLAQHHHLLLRTPEELQDSLSALKVLLGPVWGFKAHLLVTQQPHLLYKSPQQLEQDLEDLLDITHLTPAQLASAVAADPGVLAHHQVEELLTRWSLLTRCVSLSPSWASDLQQLSGAGLATALTAPFSALDGLHFLQDRGQDTQMTLAQALVLCTTGGGPYARKFRRWKQRHVLPSEWHSLHSGTPEQLCTSNGVEACLGVEAEGLQALSRLARAHVLQYLMGQQQAQALAEAEAATRQQRMAAVQAALATAGQKTTDS